MIQSHDRLAKSFSREVIEKKPHIFKIETLTNIRGLFPQDTPFYAGFGNRETDKVSYRAVGIPEAKVFIVNPKGEVQYVDNEVLQTTYAAITQNCDQLFP